MSKAEDRALEYCCTKCANNKLDCGMKLISHGRNCIECGNYIKGYEQAEKDSELTWEDISTIRQIMFDYNRTIRNEMTLTSNENYCKEVLKRFKKTKNVD